tara:strand:+ start:519 stop:1364 length:846 start_codon:yes stop_codon:yes gene_type:complete
MRGLILLIIVLCSIKAQDDELLNLINEGIVSPSIPVVATFKATRIVNAQSIELARPQTLEFMILHRFGSMKNGFYDLFGMDEAVIRFDLKYGLSDRLSLGFGRSSLNKTYDLFTKIKVLKQTNGSNSFPMSVVLFSKIEIETITKKMEMSDRFTYALQALVARKINQSFSLQVMPTLIHRNLVETFDESNDLFSCGIGGRLKITRRTSLNFDTFLPIGKRQESFKQSWGIGVDIDTGGHVFQLMLTNAQGSFESQYIENAYGGLEDLNLFLGFNITRAFSL